MTPPQKPGRSGDNFRTLVRQLMLAADQGLPLAGFLDEVTERLLDVSGGGAVEIHLEEWVPSIRYRAIRRQGAPFFLETERIQDRFRQPEHDGSPQTILCRAVLHGVTPPPERNFTPRGTFWAFDTRRCGSIDLGAAGAVELTTWRAPDPCRSLILIPMRVEGRPLGLLQFVAERSGVFDIVDVRFFEDVAELLGLVLTHHRVQWAAQERVKELTCLYGIARVAGTPGLDLSERLRAIAALLPPGWQYPESCEARVVFDGESYATAGFRETELRQKAQILVEGRPRGSVEVIYTTPQPEFQEGPFLAEERNLIDEVARRIGLIIEGKLADEERHRLQEQLLHADRLATIGKLAAGIAHELSEPLGAILGFAQLAGQVPGLPEQTRRDLEKIVQASLRAREIIKKLLFFGRQTPPAQAPIDLNRVVTEGLTILEPRFAAQAVRLTLRLGSDLPQLVADPGQVQQVVVNLVLNSIQAMPGGGEIEIATEEDGEFVLLSVTDTGVGMSREVLSQVFEPFFSTKEVGQGTGLGLSVVHGIVTAHKGRIDVSSEPGRGSRFEVRLPVRQGAK